MNQARYSNNAAQRPYEYFLSVLMKVSVPIRDLPNTRLTLPQLPWHRTDMVTAETRNTLLNVFNQLVSILNGKIHGNYHPEVLNHDMYYKMQAVAQAVFNQDPGTSVAENELAAAMNAVREAEVRLAEAHFHLQQVQARWGYQPEGAPSTF